MIEIFGPKSRSDIVTQNPKKRQRQNPRKKEAEAAKAKSEKEAEAAKAKAKKVAEAEQQLRRLKAEEQLRQLQLQSGSTHEFHEVFLVRNGRISPRVKVRICNVTMGPNVTFGKETSFSGVSVANYIGQAIIGDVQSSVYVIRGFVHGQTNEKTFLKGFTC
jgi:hypothetical protein